MIITIVAGREIEYKGAELQAICKKKGHKLVDLGIQQGQSLEPIDRLGVNMVSFFYGQTSYCTECGAIFVDSTSEALNNKTGK